MNYLQAHHLDLDFYDRFFEPGAYLRTHAEHMQRWHAERRAGMGAHVRAGAGHLDGAGGKGPDVLLIGGLGDTVESWQFQLDGLADRYRLTAFDNRGAGGRAMPEGTGLP